MSTEKIEALLARIEKPSRYLGSEINTVRKDPRAVRLRIALAFPDLYEIGTSHFGLQILYHILNRRPEIAAERVFAPAADLEARLRESATPLFTLESHAPLGGFDIIGFSLLYELNYTNVLNMLDLAGVPLAAAERRAGHPVVIAGGPCTCNPEPVAEFFDALVIGDGEQVVLDLADRWLEWKASGAGDRQDLLGSWAKIEGVYVPSFFEACHDAEGVQRLAPRRPGYANVRRAVIGDLDLAPFPDRPVVPFGKPVHDRLRLEVSRGCTRGCRFCQAGMIYRPVRERAPLNLLDLAERALANTGYEDLSLMSLSTGDYGCIAPLMARLMARLSGERVAVSLPSLRAGTLTPELMELIRKVRKTGFTIAPEAGSQRLRDAINKNISEQEIVDTVTDAFQLGWSLVKLYFMIGLPTETEADLEELVRLAHRLRRIKSGGPRRGQINVSLATFIPKPHTPFQWAAQLGLAESRARLRWVQERLAVPGVQFKWQNPEMSLLEGVFARGDRRLGPVLLNAFRRGCRFDGWSDQFDFAAWMAAFADCGIDPGFYTARERAADEVLPWDHVDSRVGLEFLRAEWEKAVAGHPTADCRDGLCHGCGVCDFELIQPKVHREIPAVDVPPEPAGRPLFFHKLQVSYSKTGSARFFGHLELANVFLRALRRAGVAVKFSEGFHPKPKVSFDNPLPSGFESEEERLVVTVPLEVTPAGLIAGLNAHLPAGLNVFACSADIRGAPPRCAFRIRLAETPAQPERFARSAIDFSQGLTLSSPKRKLKKIDLKDILFDIGMPEPRTLVMTLACEPGNTVRPGEVLRQVFGLSEETVQTALIRKLKAAPG